MTLAVLLTLTLVTGASPPPPLNAIIGDSGFIAAHHREPTPDDPEVQRIRDHLAFVVALLRAANHDFDDATLARRNALIAELEAYAAAGVFPQNHVYPGRRPVFIDPDGALCAVGYLVAISAGRDAAEAIAARHRYDYVLDMNEPALESWAADNGFTLLELATIQPGYGWEPHPFPIDPIEPTPIVPEPVSPFPPPPPGVPELAMPSPAAWDALVSRPWVELPDGAVWTKVDHAGQQIVMRIDADRRVTAIATSIFARSTDLAARYTWRAFYPTGELLAKGQLRNGLPTGRWTFYAPDGGVLKTAVWSKIGWR